MEPPARPPRLRCWLFPLIYPSHLLVLPATFGLHLFWQTYPYFPAFYAIPVRRTKGLPTASFRFHLTVNTLAVQLCASSLPTRTRDFHPLEPAHGGRTKKPLLIAGQQELLKNNHCCNCLASLYSARLEPTKRQASSREHCSDFITFSMLLIKVSCIPSSRPSSRPSCLPSLLLCSTF